MPTKGYFLRKENFIQLETAAEEAGCSPSEYLNHLIEEDKGGGSFKAPVIKNKKEVVEKISGNKGDGLHTCKKCGYMLPMYKGKCKYC